MSNWTVPAHSKSLVDRAGRTLVAGGDAAELDRALEIISNWRSSHSFPLNTIVVTLKRVARRRDPNPLVAQRIKRLPSIRHKLERFPKMNLSQMQDIGGCRAVVSSVAQVEAMRKEYRYLEVERAIAGTPGAEAVLVSVDSLDALRRAYPNYFLDTNMFLRAVDEAVA